VTEKPAAPGSPAHDSPGVLFPPPLLYVLLVAAGWAIDRRAPWRLPEIEGVITPAELLGAILLAVGLTLDLLSLAQFLRSRTNALPFRPASAFVVGWPYGWTRNPMYLGMTSVTLGVALLTGRLWWLVSAAVAALAIDRFVIPREEAYLERRFGAAYLDYKRRVRRWF